MIIAIAGKNELACRVLDYIIESKKYSNYKLCVVLNKTDNGINSWQRSLKSAALLNGIDIVDEEYLYRKSDLLFLSLEYDRIIKVERFRSKKLYNVHFSYLPDYKGMYTSVLPILFNDSSTGVTLHRINNGIDTGDIIDQRKITLSEGTTSENLYYQLTNEGVEIIKSNLNSLLKDEFESHPQSAINSRYFKKGYINFANVEIDTNQTAFQIKIFVNAFCFPPYQRATFNNYKIDRVVILSEVSKKRPGFIHKEDEYHLVLSTIDYDIILIKACDEFLIECSQKGDFIALKKYKSIGGRINFKNQKGWDIAITASYNGHFEILEWALNNGISPDTKNYNGTTLAMYTMTYSIANKNYNYFENFLKKYQPNLNLKDYSGHDITYYAQKRKSLNAIELIQNYK